ncbi:ABC transporter permease [Clostridium sediminicola]|uniref:ABC transporter permease n=1 Tax=Clostridium sediminicola TaxID=3114879 RepID=UPI0031F276CF
MESLKIEKTDKKSMSYIKKILNSDKIGLIIALVIMIAIFASLSPHYFTPGNFMNILIAASLTGLVAVGESFLIISTYIDLSPGSVAAFSGVLCSVLLSTGLGTVPVIILVIIAGLCIGAFNAFFVNELKIEPFIASLAAMSIFRGLAYIICDGKPVFITNSTFLKIGVGRILGIPIPVIILLLTFIVFGIILSKTKLGRHTYIIGGNKNAARLAGINPKKVALKLYMIMGALSAIGGIILASRMTSGQPSAFVGLEFDGITAAVLGGMAFSGGVGTMFGTVLGVLILQGFNNGLLLLNVPSFWQYVARGLLLLAALSFDYFRSKKRAKA